MATNTLLRRWSALMTVTTFVSLGCRQGGQIRSAGPKEDGIARAIARYALDIPADPKQQLAEYACRSFSWGALTDVSVWVRGTHCNVIAGGGHYDMKYEVDDKVRAWMKANNILAIVGSGTRKCVALEEGAVGCQQQGGSWVTVGVGGEHQGADHPPIGGPFPFHGWNECPIHFQ